MIANRFLFPFPSTLRSGQDWGFVSSSLAITVEEGDLIKLFPGLGGILAGDESTSRRSANRAMSERSREACPLCGEAVEVRRDCIRVAVTAEVRRNIFGNDPDDIRARIGGVGEAYRTKKNCDRERFHEVYFSGLGCMSIHFQARSSAFTRFVFFSKYIRSSTLLSAAFPPVFLMP